MSAIAGRVQRERERELEPTHGGNGDGEAAQDGTERPPAVSGQASQQRDDEGLEPLTLLVLVGLPGSGKTTFASALVATSRSDPDWPLRRPWTRASQDDAPRQRRQEAEAVARAALGKGENVVVDRVDFDVAQRAHFLTLARTQGARATCLFLTCPEATLRRRLAVREGHPTLPDAATALQVLGRMRAAFVPPTLGEGFDRVLSIDAEGEWTPRRIKDVLDRIEREGAQEPRGAGRGQGRGRGAPRGRTWGSGRGGGGAAWDGARGYARGGYGHRGGYGARNDSVGLVHSPYPRSHGRGGYNSNYANHQDRGHGYRGGPPGHAHGAPGYTDAPSHAGPRPGYDRGRGSYPGNANGGRVDYDPRCASQATYATPAPGAAPSNAQGPIP